MRGREHGKQTYRRSPPESSFLLPEDLRVILRVELPGREAVVELQIRVRVGFFQRRISTRLRRPQKRVEVNRDSQLVVEKQSRYMKAEILSRNRMNDLHHRRRSAGDF